MIPVKFYRQARLAAALLMLALIALLFILLAVDVYVDSVFPRKGLDWREKDYYIDIADTTKLNDNCIALYQINHQINFTTQDDSLLWVHNFIQDSLYIDQNQYFYEYNDITCELNDTTYAYQIYRHNDVFYNT